MRKVTVVFCVIGLLCLSAMPLWAGGIINKSNLSADYFRSLTRNAGTDAADIVAYNPAGVMKLDNGFYTKLDVLYVAKEYSNTVPDQAGIPFAGEDGDFTSDEPSIVPGFFTVYKQDDWAGFFAVTIPGGGGKVKFDEGSAYTSLLALNIWNQANSLPINPYTGLDSASIEADSYDIGYTLGGAYKINPMFSLAGGVRYVSATQNYKGRVDMATPAPSVQDVFEVDLERSATGWGYFLGLNAAPVEALNVGLLFISNTSLNMKSKVKKDTSLGSSITRSLGWSDGTKRHEDLPGLVGVGVSYRFTPKIRAEVDYTHYLEDNAKLDSISGRYDNAGDSYDFAMSLEYTFNPQWKASLGYMITDIKGMEPEQLIPLAPELDARTYAAGAVYSPGERWQYSFGYTYVDYASVTTSTTSASSPAGSILEKDTWAISAGIQYRWF